MSRYVNQPVRKKDAMALVTGQPVYTEDVAPKNCLTVKIIRSPYASAVIESVNKAAAMKVPGVVGIYTWEDCPDRRFTIAGQTYPEPSPYDRLILDRRVRFVGDAAVIVAAETKEAAEKAARLVKIRYREEEPVLDFKTALDNPVLVHPEENWQSLCPVGADNKRNLCASGSDEKGDVEAVLAACPYTVDRTYHVKAVNQTMMETFRTCTYLDPYGRLVVLSSTQIPFHVRRIVANALDISKAKVRVIKPRIGGGFGAKQSAVTEVYPALVTWLTGRPAMIIYSREESMMAGSPRHEMEIRVRVGADQDGIIRGIDMYTLSNTGAYSEHGPTTVGLSGHKSIPLYGKTEAFSFRYDVVYTNLEAAGAYRGYGATQGLFALESAVNELADRLGMDPVVIREKNMLKEGERMPAYYNEPNNSCALDRCMKRAKELFDWDGKPYAVDMGNGKVRSKGVAMAMQGSSISNCDTGSVTIKVGDDGIYNMLIGATDMGTGCDTILAQMAADCLETDLDNISVFGVDTDVSPYDSGSYASSTTYLTGQAVVRCCEQLKKTLLQTAAERLSVSPDQLEFDGTRIFSPETEQSVSLAELGNAAMLAGSVSLSATVSCKSLQSPPPYMVGMVELEVDTETGEVEILDYVAVVDCGTVINPNLARVQTEGGLAQGIGMTLFENITHNKRGKLQQTNFMQYKIPTRLDIGRIRVAFESSYEPSGPFGAKSIGELVINTPAPAIVNAIYNATGLRFYELPVTPEQIAMGVLEKEK